jgi:hypothetical protein
LIIEKTADCRRQQEKEILTGFTRFSGLTGFFMTKIPPVRQGAISGIIRFHSGDQHQQFYAGELRNHGRAAYADRKCQFPNSGFYQPE